MLPQLDSGMEQKGLWLSLNSTYFFRLVDIDELLWKIRTPLNSYLVAGTSFGGFFALFWSEENGAWRKDENNQKKIELYTSLGSLINDRSVVYLDKRADVFFVAWNESENHLIVVMCNGEICFFHVNGEQAAPSVFLPAPFVKAIGTESGVIGIIRIEEKVQVILVKHAESKGYIVSILDISYYSQECDTMELLLGAHSSDDVELYLFYPSSESTTTASGCKFSNSFSPYVRKMNVSIDGIVDKAAMSPNGQLIALHTVDGNIYVGSVAFEEVVVVHTRPLSEAGSEIFKPSLPSFAPFMFCGNDAIFSADWAVGHRYDNEFTVEEGDQTNFYFTLSAVDGSSEVDLSDDIPQSSFFFPERDGIRIVSSTRCYFLQIIAPQVQRVCAVGSTAPGAVLRSAYEGFSAGNTSAVRAIHQLQQNLSLLIEAIDDCIHTAASEWSVEMQQHFLRVAAFGKSFARSYDADFFVSTTEKIRVRNTLRTVSKMILSHDQLQQLGEHHLARRLLCSGHHLLVWRICCSLHCMEDAILSEWMVSKLAYDVAQGKTEGDAARAIVSFLKQPIERKSNSAGNSEARRVAEEIPFTELANVAQINGNRAAALVLLDAEEVPTRQVPVLLAFGEPEKGLVKAIAASDSDLIFTVIQYMLRAGGSAKDVQFIANYPDARDLLLTYISVCPHYRDYLRDYYLAHPTLEQYLEVRDYLNEDRYLRQKIQEKAASAEDFCNTFQKRKSEILQRLPLLVGCSSVSETKKNSSSLPLSSGASSGPYPATSGGGNRSAPGHSAGEGGKLSERYLCLQIGLVEKQTQFAKTYNDERYLTASVADMLFFLLQRAEDKAMEDALSLRREYCVPEEMMQWARLKAFAATKQWDQVDQMGGINSRQKPVLSGESLVTLLLSYDRLEQASKHISRIPNLEDRLEYYVQCGNWTAAGADCGRVGATELLEQLQARARGSAASQEQIKKGWDMTVGSSSGLTFGKLFFQTNYQDK